MSKSNQKEGKPRLSVDMSNAVLSNAITKTKERFKVSRTKAVEILAIKGWKVLSGKSEQFPSERNGNNFDDYELMPHAKLISQLKINLIDSYRFGTQSDEHSGTNHYKTLKPIQHSITIEEWVLPDKVYSEKKVRYSHIREVIKSRLEVMAPMIATLFPFTPDATLCFARRADVSFHKVVNNKDVKDEVFPLSKLSENHVLMKIKMSLTCIPACKSMGIAKITDYLDFDGIAYETFKTIATKGWNRNKYSHYLYIEDANLYRGGGYFIGVTREPCLSHFDQNNDYLPQSIISHENSIQYVAPIRFFQDGMSIIITKSSLNMIKTKILEDKIEQPN